MTLVASSTNKCEGHLWALLDTGTEEGIWRVFGEFDALMRRHGREALAEAL